MSQEFIVKKYVAGDETLWNQALLHNAKNGTFLFHRKYLAYHKDRFQDHSLLFFKNKRLQALLPAHIKNKKIISHGGLTFGGIIFITPLKTKEYFYLWYALLEYLKNIGVTQFYFSPIPPLFHTQEREDEKYITHLCQAKIISRKLSSVLYDLKHFNEENQLSKGKKWNIKKALQKEISVKPSDDLESFWEILTQNLSHRHDTKPTHSLEEMQYLKQTFPDKIKLYFSFSQKEILAGVLIYFLGKGLHTQYIASTPKGREYFATDYLILSLIEKYRNEKEFLSFGSSMEKENINFNLLHWKESFGSKTYFIDNYKFNNINKLSSSLLKHLY